MEEHEIRRRNIDGARYYEVRPGVNLRSVTTILGVISKPGLVFWAANIGAEAAMELLRPYEGKKLTGETLRAVDHAMRNAHREVKETAADYGTLVHQAIESKLKGRAFMVSDDLLPVIERFQEFLDQEDIEPILVEGVVYSEKEGIYAGTVDVAGKRRGRKDYGVAIDWKSSKDIYPEHMLQSAAYAKGLEERLGVPMKEAWVVRCHNKEGELDFDAKMIKGAELEQAFETFKAAQQLDNGLRMLKRSLKMQDPL
jgi:hypothetical protein